MCLLTVILSISCYFVFRYRNAIRIKILRTIMSLKSFCGLKTESNPAIGLSSENNETGKPLTDTKTHAENESDERPVLLVNGENSALYPPLVNNTKL